MKQNRIYKILIAIICTFTLLFSNIIYTISFAEKVPENGTVMTKNSSEQTMKYHNKRAGWYIKGVNSWYYYNKRGVMQTGWLNEKGNWYYFNTKEDGKEGQMRYGWYQDKNHKRYFLNTRHDRTFGKRLVGWHWIDGYRYYFGNDGVLYQNTTTPDGSQVDKDGRYMKNSIIQHVGGKGLSLKPHMSEQTKKNFLQNQTQQAKGDNKAKKERESNHDSKQDETYTVTFDFNDGMPSKKETQSVKEGNYVEYLEPPYRDGYYFLAWYQEKEVQDFDNGFSFDGTPIHKDITLYALWLDTTHDSDSDGLLDGHEMILKTDPHKTDTDGDGLTDSEEHNFTTTDPLKTHTYLDDTADAELDIDGDGLTNLEEVRFGSNPIFEDYDEDSLNDKQEKEHGTNPNNKDTDSDGLIDGLEIKYGFNPTNPDTNGDGILDGDELITVTKKYDGIEGNSRPSAVIKLKAGSTEHISIERDNPKESIWIPEEVPGLLDASYDFEVDGEIEEATLTFHFDETYAPSEEFEPAIYYVDTENQEMILLEDQDIDWINHTVTAKTKHFSKYVLLNKKQQEKAWKEEILSSGNIGNNARIEVSFVIDESGSMSSNDSGKVRVEVAKKFIDTLRNSDKAAVIGFAYDGITYQALTENLQAAKQSLDNISNNRGGTNLSAGLEQAMAQYPVAGNNSNQKEQAMKIIVFLTDGEGSYNKQYEQMAIERGIKIYTVGLGNYYDKALLTKISNNTGGKHYHANNAEQLIQEFQKLTRDTIDVVNDTDHDGLSDYHEERIRLFNGVVVKLDKMKADTDSDGLKDGQEIIQRTDKKGRVFFKLRSYPNKRDSDGDGIEDKQDEKPLIPQRYTIDYLGSPKHLKSVEERLDKQIKNNLLSLDKADKPNVIGILGTQLLMNDYDTFLKERKVNTKGKFREDYWKKDWDKYWDEYCSNFNSYVKHSGSVTEKVHYFRNNLNRIPTTLQQLNSQSSNWVLLKVGSSGYHMCPTSFSETGSYNLKFISKNGRNEGVYINYYGSNNKNKNKGKACTEKTDPKNMGTYNFSGMYYAKGKASKEAKDHFQLDMLPYYNYGNVSRNDLPGDEETNDKNKGRYKKNYDALRARTRFVREWKGMVE